MNNQEQKKLKPKHGESKQQRNKRVIEDEAEWRKVEYRDKEDLVLTVDL